MRYLIVALVVSLAWLHQDWLIWPLLSEVQKEHDLILGIPAGLGYQVALSFATAAVWFLAVWKAWPSELENWASAGENRRGGGSRDRGRSQGGRDNRGRTQRGDYRPSGDRDRGERSERSGDGSGEGRSRRRRGGRGRRSGGQGNGGQGNGGGTSNSPNNPS